MSVISQLIEGYEVHAEVLGDGHVVIGDEPAKMGGTNKGPSPFALLQMSLAN